MITRFDEALHPRGTGAQGGQFVAKGSQTAASKTAAKKTTAKKASGPPKGSMAFDGKRGPGYGVKGGDKRVKGLQDALNRLGFTDGGNKKLVEDGKLGPRTTAAIKKAQRALGLKPDGVVTPDLLKKLTGAKSPKDLKKAPAKKAAPKKAAKKAAPAKKRTEPTRKPTIHKTKPADPGGA
jgi:peptidoglycan hydrolase-like protein with peptidoglycan-binding domain